jgi:integrase
LKKLRQNKSAFIVEEHDVLGKAKVLRTAQSGKIYQLRMWVPDEKKYVRETLKTRDLKTAMLRAEKRVFEIFSDIQTGRKIFGIRLSELVEKYQEWRQQDVDMGNITAGRLVTIKSQLKHLLTFKGSDTKVNELERLSCFEYANWRRKNVESVKDVTIRNEQATINHLMKFAYRNGYSHLTDFEFRKLRVRHEENDRRDTFDLGEYDSLVRFMRSWTSKKSCGDNESLRQKRLLMRDCVLIASNTMLRVGELWQLKWSDILGYETRTDDTGKSIVLVTLKVRGEISKTRKSRMVTSRGGEYFRRLHKRTKFKDDSDYVFCGDDGQKRLSKKELYSCWAELMNGIEIDRRGVFLYLAR